MLRFTYVLIDETTNKLNYIVEVNGEEIFLNEIDYYTMTQYEKDIIEIKICLN